MAESKIVSVEGCSLVEETEQSESQIVSAVGVSSGMHVAGQEKSDLNKAIEKAMSEAVTQANADGLSDPDQIRQRILKARDKVLDEPYDG